MGEIDADDGVFTAEIKNPGMLLTLPDELSEWARQNQTLVLRIQDALADTYDTLTEDQLWEVIAANSSPVWREARKDLRTTETELARLNHPRNASLGLIGSALDSEETHDIHERHSISLAHFAVIDEGLRARPDLSRLLSVLMVQKRMLDHSTEQTRQMQATTRSAMRNDFAGAAERDETETPSRISRIFGAYARKLLGGKTAPSVRTAPAPSSPET